MPLILFEISTMSNASGPISDLDTIRRLLDGWDTMPAGATTFIFSPDPQMDVALYKKTFNLTDEECETIRRFTSG